MKILKSYKKGINQTTRNFRMLITLWGFNLVFSLVVAMPIISLFTKGLNRSLMGEQVAQKVSMLWLGDVFSMKGDIYGILGSSLTIAAVSYLVVHVFLNGGIIAQLTAKGGKMTMGSFLKDCSDYFWRFFKLFTVSIIFYIFAVTFLHGIASQILDIFKKQAITGWTYIFVSNLSMLLLILLISIVNMIFDYAKILTVLQKEQKIRHSLKHALMFLRSTFFSAWGLFLLPGLTFLAVTLIYMEMAQILPDHSIIQIALLFLWQQIFVFSKIGIKIQFFASQAHYYQSQ